MKVYGELTDTYGGESNYSWVRRAEVEVPEGTSDLACVRKIKALLGLSGSRPVRRENHGDMISLWSLDGSATVLFITFEG